MNGPSKNTIEKSMALPTVLYEEIHIFYHGELVRREYEMYHKLVEELKAENQQQMAIIEEQAAIIAELEAKIEQQDAQIEQLEAKRIQLEEQLAEQQQCQKGKKLEKEDVACTQLMRKRSCIDDNIFVHDSVETKKFHLIGNDNAETDNNEKDKSITSSNIQQGPNLFHSNRNFHEQIDN